MDALALDHAFWPSRGRVFLAHCYQPALLYIVKEWNSEAWFFDRLEAPPPELNIPRLDDFVLLDADAQDRLDAMQPEWLTGEVEEEVLIRSGYWPEEQPEVDGWWMRWLRSKGIVFDMDRGWHRLHKRNFK